MYNNKEILYSELLEWIELGNTLKSRRVQEMMIIIYRCFQNSGPMIIKNLNELRNSKYNLRGWNRPFIPNLNSIKYGLKSFRYYAAKQWNAFPEQI